MTVWENSGAATRWCSPRWVAGWVCLGVLLAASPVLGESALEQHLLDRIAAHPQAASNWRLLGRVYLQQVNLPAAEHALRQAVALDAASPAAQYDLGRVLLQTESPQAGVACLQQAIDLAPDSEHAQTAQVLLDQLREDPRYATLISFQTAWQEAPRAAALEPEDMRGEVPAPRFDFDFEAGWMFNSNVELAPISRQLSSSELSSFQTYVVPEARYLLVDRAQWQLGTMLSTYFNVNESHLKALNLQHYEPGLYYDWSTLWGATELATRVSYQYALDQFGGSTLGDRHLLTTSLVAFHEQPVRSMVYWSLGQTDFRDDGAVPAVDSADGLTQTIGCSRVWDRSESWIEQFSLGVDLQWADLEGVDNAYRGVFLYSEAKRPFWWDSELTSSAGWGYRDFPDFTAAPSRNENLITAGVRCEKVLRAGRALTAFFHYDRFDTPHPDFAASRYTTGLSLSLFR